MWNRSRFPMTFSFVGILSSILFFLLLTGFQLFLQSLVSEELFETRGRKWRKASCKKKEGMVGPGSIADLARCSNHTSLLPRVASGRLVRRDRRLADINFFLTLFFFSFWKKKRRKKILMSESTSRLQPSTFQKFLRLLDDWKLLGAWLESDVAVWKVIP